MEFPSGFILELWERAGFSIKRSGSSWVSAECPRCGRARTGHRVSIDPDRNVWKCFAEGCGAQGGVKDFCVEMGWDFQEILRSAGLLEERKGREREHREGQGGKEPVGDLSSILTANLSSSVREYLCSRGIEPELVEGYVFGIDPSTHDYARWLWDRGYRFFVPQYRPKEDDWEIVSGRFRLARDPGEGEVKSRSPRGRSNFLYREKLSAPVDVGLILEGEMDFLSALVLVRKNPDLLDQYALFAVPGAKYTFRDEEIEDLPPEVVLFLDRGAEEEVERLARQLYARGKKVFLGRYPEPYKDLNDWLRSEGVRATAKGLIRAIERACVEGAYTPLRGIVREVEDFVAEVERLVKEKESLSREELLKRSKVYPTGIFELDEILSGGFRPALYGIAGAPGSGKTSFILALIRRIIERNHAYVLFASLEMPLKQIIAYMLSWGARMSWLKILNAEVDRDGLERIKKAKEDLKWLFKSLHVLQAPMGVEDVERELIELKNMALDEERLFFVVVDYLQMLKLRGHDIRLGITNAVRKLAEMANRHEVPVMIVSSTARGVVEEALKGKRSPKEVFKESGDIEYALFAGFLLDKKEERENGERINRLVVAKNRGGAELKGGKPIEIEFSFNVFTGEITGVIQ